MSEGSSSAIDRLVRMANQIALAFQAQPQDEAVSNIAAHIKSFWTPKMRRDVIAHLQAGGADVAPLARAAFERLH